MAIDPDVPPHGSGNAGSYSQFLQWLVVNIPDEDIERGESQVTTIAVKCVKRKSNFSVAIDVD